MHIVLKTALLILQRIVDIEYKKQFICKVNEVK